ncbi:Sodium- and chloride-dependent GABA transporter 1 [Pestalotiopsis sp. IQ-011]
MPLEYRPLLPAFDNGSAASSTTPAPKMSAEAPKRKRAGVAVACDLCRSRKTRLMVNNPILYPAIHSLSERNIVESHLLRPVSSARTEPDGHLSAEDSSNIPETTHNIGIDNPEIDSDSIIRHFRPPFSQAISARQESTLCDERLNDLDISFWTPVPIPNGLAAKVISLYLVTDHPLLGIFEPGQFIADLVNHKQISCSSFLVNTLLYWGCMYSAIEKEANNYAEQLSAEAVRLWTIEKNFDSILTMISVQMLSLAFMGNGKDHNVVVYQIESVKMGARLGLLGVDEETAASKLAKIPYERMNAYSFAAWGVFNWAM